MYLEQFWEVLTQKDFLRTSSVLRFSTEDAASQYGVC